MKDNEESMWDDYDYYQNTGELSDYFEDEEEDDDDVEEQNNGGLRIDLSDPYLIDKLDAVIADLKKRNAEMEATQELQSEIIPEPEVKSNVEEPAEVTEPEKQLNPIQKFFRKIFGH